jgi:hypothetical protein
VRTLAFISSFLVLISFSVSAQYNGDQLLNDATTRRFMSRHDTLYAFYAISPDRPLKTNIDKTYYWFSKDSIFTTAGGYSGRLLHGEYKVFYPDKSLRESGYFRYGLKDGPWKTWYPDGSLESVVYWKKGNEKGPVKMNESKQDD